MPYEIKIAVVFVIAIAAAATSAYLAPVSLTPPPLLQQLQYMATLALFVERSVEIYLGVSKKNGRERVPLTSEELDRGSALQAASIAALVLGLALSLSGVRILPSAGINYYSQSGFISNLQAGIDIVISGALIAGGSALLHELTEAIKGNIRKFSAPEQVLQSGASASSTLLSTQLAATKSYTIDILRPTGADVQEGKITFKDGGVSIEAKCWWDKLNRIDPGTYKNCSKTMMATVDIEGIYIKDAKSKITGSKEIFMHRGVGPENSNGCIAVETVDFNTLWNHIQPKDGQNITVNIKDI